MKSEVFLMLFEFLMLKFVVMLLHDIHYDLPYLFISSERAHLYRAIRTILFSWLVKPESIYKPDS